MEAAHQHLIEGAAEEAHAIDTQIKAALADGREAVWRLAEAVHASRENRHWAKLGHETIEEWLAQAEIGMKSSWYHTLAQAWQKLVIERKVERDRLNELEPTKVSRVLPQIVKGSVPLDEALADAETLGFRDLREKYQPPKEPKEPESVRTDSGDDPPPDPAGDLDTTPQDPIRPDSRAEEPPFDEDEDAPDEGGEEAAETVEDAVAEEQTPEANGVAEEPQEDDLRPITELDGPEEPTDPMTLDGMKAEGETLGWDELRVAIGSGAAYPRMKRTTMMELLAWAEKWELV